MMLLGPQISNMPFKSHVIVLLNNGERDRIVTKKKPLPFAFGSRYCLEALEAFKVGVHLNLSEILRGLKKG